MAGLTNLKLLTDFFNKIGHKRTHAVQQTAPLNWLVQLGLSLTGLTQPGSCRLQFLASFVSCGHDAHIFRQFKCGLKLRLSFILAAFPPSNGTEAEVAFHREW
jgi:hypothetical protein